jgi:hypothetical protein
LVFILLSDFFTHKKPLEYILFELYLFFFEDGKEYNKWLHP